MVRTRAALALVLAGCLLAGCSNDDPKPNIADPTTPAPSSPTSTAATVATTQPSSTTRDLDPEETVRAWVDAWNVALRTGDTSTLRAYDAASCRGCDELIGPVETIASAGGSFKGGSWKVDGLTVVESTTTAAKVNLGVDVAAGSTVASAGAEPTAYPSTKHILRVTLVREAGRWRFSVIELLS